MQHGFESRWAYHFSAKMLAPDIQALHEAACARGEAGYLDPQTGLFVLTARFLLERGTCCASGCRHCPYDKAD